MIEHHRAYEAENRRKNAGRKYTGAFDVRLSMVAELESFIAEVDKYRRQDRDNRCVPAQACQSDQNAGNEAAYSKRFSPDKQ
jgi:hypothetical protein